MKVISRTEAKTQKLKKYYTGTICPSGHNSERFVSNYKCCECRKIYNDTLVTDRKTKYIENKDAMLIYSKKYRELNGTKLNEIKKRYNSKNRARRKAYYNNNKELLRQKRKCNRDRDRINCIRWRNENRESNIIKARKYRKDNPLLAFTRGSLSRIEKASGLDRINRAEIQLGYTQIDFKEHITSLFSEGMSWENRSEWHIDHIVPLSWWIKNGVTDVSMINALINLQPLWAIDNLTKGDKI